MKRRQFLDLSASAGLYTVLQAHGLLAQMSCTNAAKINTGDARITALRLLTIASLEELKKFYGGTIGLPVVSETKTELVVQAGKTVLTFIKTDQKTSRPFYHFAFNIPENKIQAAFEWQRAKTPIIHPNPAGTKDMIVNFAHWNAHSIFFLDPAGNLVEYIARHDLVNAAEGNFTVKDILCASEIGLIVNDVVSSGNELQKNLSLSQYRPVTPGFWPIGDENGLLLMIGKGKHWASHPGQVNETSVFTTSVSIQTAVKSGWKFPGYPYEILTG
jgi:hypothetical protein